MKTTISRNTDTFEIISDSDYSIPYSTYAVSEGVSEVDALQRSILIEKQLASSAFRAYKSTGDAIYRRRAQRHWSLLVDLYSTLIAIKGSL